MQISRKWFVIVVRVIVVVIVVMSLSSSYGQVTNDVTWPCVTSWSTLITPSVDSIFLVTGTRILSIYLTLLSVGEFNRNFDIW